MGYVQGLSVGMAMNGSGISFQEFAITLCGIAIVVGIIVWLLNRNNS